MNIPVRRPSSRARPPRTALPLRRPRPATPDASGTPDSREASRKCFSGTVSGGLAWVFDGPRKGALRCGVLFAALAGLIGLGVVIASAPGFVTAGVPEPGIGGCKEAHGPNLVAIVFKCPEIEPFTTNLGP